MLNKQKKLKNTDRTRVQIRLTAKTVKRLDTFARASGIPRNAVIITAIESHLAR